MSDYDPNFKPIKSFFIVGQKAIILNDKNHILLLKRSAKTSAAGHWSLPGGGLEADENPYQSIQREISEETGLSVTDLKPYYLYKTLKNDNDQVLIIAYVCYTVGDLVKLNWEHDTFQWIATNKALTMDLTKHASVLIEMYLNNQIVTT